MSEHVGPCVIDCPENCEVPEGLTLVEVPMPRHQWSDVLVCPNEGCDKALLITQRGDNG